MKRICAILALALPLAALPRVDAAAESAPESARSLLLRMQEEAAAPVIQHCNASVPEQKAFLDAEYASFKDKFRAANLAMLEACGSRAGGQPCQGAGATALRQYIHQEEAKAP